mmetsp:Transcript_22212/g.61633  ORF Transcript_22212/g.61633 Transcript_22212/m.61633 type:complete len:490 (-) Transcript_22212:109-1578(-)
MPADSPPPERQNKGDMPPVLSPAWRDSRTVSPILRSSPLRAKDSAAHCSTPSRLASGAIMADHRSGPQKKRPIWPLIGGLVVLGCIVYSYRRGKGASNQRTAAPTPRPLEPAWRQDFSWAPSVALSLATIKIAEEQMGEEAVSLNEAPEMPANGRLVAIGDIHGDYKQAFFALQLAGLVDAQGHWAGGSTVVVQTGDLVDRGDNSLAVLSMFERLKAQALAAGGDVIMLLGNHELMNLQGDYRYISKNELAKISSDDTVEKDVKSARRPPKPRKRDTMAQTLGLERWNNIMGPQNMVGRMLRNRRTVAVVGEGNCRTLFVHAGILPGLLAEQGLGQKDIVGPKLLWALNKAMRDILENCDRQSCGLQPSQKAFKLMADDSPVWHRGYAMGDEAMVCVKLQAVLQTVSAHRMVVGHTVQEDGRVHTRCNDLLHLIDVGMARVYLGSLATWQCTAANGVEVLYPGERQPITEAHSQELMFSASNLGHVRPT